MVGYTFSPSVVPSETQPGKFDVGCRVVYTGGDGVEQFIEHRVWLTGIEDQATACGFAHQTVKFMLAYYERMINGLVERMLKNEPITGFGNLKIDCK